MEKNKVLTETEEPIYRKAKLPQLFLFPLAELANMLFFLAMMFVSFYATGIAGLGVVVVSMVLTGIRIFDGMLTPIVGLLIDKTQGKFGKIRPFLVIGYLFTLGCALLVFFTTHYIPESFRLVYFIVIYTLHILGFNLVALAAQSGYAILTNDPTQRPIIGGLNVLYTTIVGAFFGMYMANVGARHGGFGNVGLFQELITVFAIGSAICMLIAIIAISPADRPENYGDIKVEKKEKVGFRTMVSVLRKNRPLQMLMVSSVTDRLAGNIANNTVINVMLFGIIIGDFGVTGVLAGVTLIPNILVIIFGMGLAAKIGTKKAYIFSTLGSTSVGILIILLLVFGDPTAIRFDAIGFMTIAFAILHVAFGAFRLLNSMTVAPMLPDVIDYEHHQSGKFIPGTILAINSTTTHFISSLYQTVVGVTLAAIGFRYALPDLDTPFTTSIFNVTIFLGFGVLIISWLFSLICMKFYPLTKEKMEEIQTELKRREEAGEIVASV